MSFGLFGPEHDDFRRTVQRFVQTEIRPHVREWEAQGSFPLELYRRCGELGFFGLRVGEAYGGTDAGPLFEAVLHEEIARCGSGGVAAGLGAHVAIASPPIAAFGSEAQKQRYLVPAVRGEKIGALAITEPDAGSDVAGLRTRCRREGDSLVLDGRKTFITNGVRADFYVVAVKSDPEATHQGLSMVLVDKGTPGFSVGRALDKLGWRASDTAELVFEDCRVPASQLLGEWNQGFLQIVRNFEWERLTMALGAVAGAAQVLEETVAYTQQRRAFGKPLTGFQVTRHKLADMHTQLEAARQLTHQALRLFAAGEPALVMVAMAKRVATETACAVIDQALQLHGGNGYMMEYDVQRHWRDARLGPIGGGTSEIMNEIIAKGLGF
jgi:acyl-CoA dehydrogenase